MGNSPLLLVHDGGISAERIEAGRTAAALALVSGCEAALTELHPDDDEKRAWYRALLVDARVIARLPSVVGLQPASEPLQA